MPSSQATPLGPAVGASLGFVVDGGWVGAAVDTEVGEVVGEIVGSELVGEAVGLPVGGAVVGPSVGCTVGSAVGEPVMPRSKQWSRGSAQDPRASVPRQWYGPTQTHRPFGLPPGAGHVMPDPWYGEPSWPAHATWCRPQSPTVFTTGRGVGVAVGRELNGEAVGAAVGAVGALVYSHIWVTSSNSPPARLSANVATTCPPVEQGLPPHSCPCTSCTLLVPHPARCLILKPLITGWLLLSAPAVGTRGGGAGTMSIQPTQNATKDKRTTDNHRGGLRVVVGRKREK